MLKALEGPYGHLLDGATENLALTDVLHVEMEPLMQHKRLIPPVLTYLFHRLEARFDGRPTLLVLDEAWTFLDEPMFAARIREWLKTLRKKNVAVLFATQSLADIERSVIAPALIESCPTRIFLPNDRALEPQMRAVYDRFGLNGRQIEILGLATPSFLLALVLLYLANVYFGTSIGGLMDPEYIDQPWSWAKVGSVLEHLWVPVIVIGTSGTAGMIRRLRANDRCWRLDALLAEPGAAGQFQLGFNLLFGPAANVDWRRRRNRGRGPLRLEICRLVVGAVQ